jgi:hypothetical protein
MNFGRAAAPLLALYLACFACPAAARSVEGDPVPTDRWMEIDLYWFDPIDPTSSADKFWTRYAPLFRRVTGYKGIVLSIGLTANYILTYSGDPDQEIALPSTKGQELGHAISGQLEGDDAMRQQAWKARFATATVAPHSVAYGRWTYRDLRKLTDAIRKRAASEGIRDFRVASFAVGQDGSYGDPMPFARTHPEAFTVWRERAPGALASSSHLDPANSLRANPRPLGGLPAGVPEGLPVHALFAAQWGAVSKAAGLDGIMLRDSFSFPRAYTRYGPFGASVPDRATADRMTRGLAALIRGAKQANPKTLIMMYSTAATATSDWRANGIDLEAIAREGYLDIFVDQSWAGAWGEVGVRQQTYWNAPILGWTYQLAYMLQHAAVLAGSEVRHYPLIETFDAWESWDTIHTAPDRLRWGIWAFSHAGVKTPDGLRMPAGAYISWGNHGAALLNEGDVAFLARELNAAAIDASRTTDISGPTIVYSREAMAAQMADPPIAGDLRDRTDEQVGSIIKWPLPILSATRAEWLPKVKSDLFLFGATKGMSPAQVQTVTDMAVRGQPMAFFGSVAGAIDPGLSGLLGVSTTPHKPAQQDRILRAVMGPAANSLAVTGASRSFSAPPTQTRNTAPPESIVYAFNDSTGLALALNGKLNLSLWDPVPIADYWYRPLRDLMYGEPAPHILASATLNRQLAQRGAISAAVTDVQHTGTVAAWTLIGGRRRILAANLEEGLRDDAERSRTLRLKLPTGWPECRDVEVGSDPSAVLQAREALTIKLKPQGSVLLSCR